MAALSERKQRKTLMELKGAILDIRSALWFRPVAYSVLAAVLAFAVPHAADAVPRAAVGWFTAADAAAVKDLLRFLAGAMLTITTVIMSAVMLVLSVAAGHASPRAVPELMADPITQRTLGTFLATFVFAFVGLVVIGLEAVDKSGIALFAALSLVLVAIALRYLVQIIHHVADSLKLNTMIARVHGQARTVMEEYLRKQGPAGRPEREAEWQDRRNREKEILVRPPRAGYVRLIDRERLDQLVETCDLVMDLSVREGDFVSFAAPMMKVWGDVGSDSEIQRQLCSTVVIGDERSNAGDPLLGLDLLSEIACRALSSGVNDVGTAVTCIDYLGSLLAPPSRIPADEYPPPISDDGRIAIKRVRFHTMLRHAFRAPARDGGDKAEVTLKILAALTHLARTSCDDYKETIVEEGRQAVDYAKARLALDRDRQAIADAFAGLQEAAGLKPEDRPRVQKRRRKEEHVGVPG